MHAVGVARHLHSHIFVVTKRASAAMDGELELDRTATPALNLAVLQRLDARIEAIVASASHAAVYENKTGNEGWVRRDEAHFDNARALSSHERQRMCKCGISRQAIASKLTNLSLSLSSLCAVQEGHRGTHLRCQAVSGGVAPSRLLLLLRRC